MSLPSNQPEFNHDSAIAHYQHVGAYLRELREHYRLDIDDVSKRLHIRSKYIVAMEEARLDELPGKVYTVGYLQSYAEFLGANPQEVLDAYRAVGSLSESKRHFRAVEPTKQKGLPSQKLLLIAVLIGGVGALFWQLFTPPARDTVEYQVEEVPTTLMPQSEARIKLTARNRRCVKTDEVVSYPPCYPWLEMHIPAAPFLFAPVKTLMELAP